MASVTFYETKESVKVDFSKAELIGYGGQGRIYKWIHNGKEYVIKTISDSTVLRRARDIRDVLLDKDLPESVSYRGLPVGQGYAAKHEVELNENVYLLVFNFVDGESLDWWAALPSFEKNPPLSDRRKKIVERMLDAMMALQRNGIVHADLYPDNFFLSGNEVYILDLVESAGVWDLKRQNWLWKPRVLGKTAVFPLPPETARDKDNFHLRHDSWVGIGTVMRILGIHPFGFLKRADHIVLEALALSSKEPDWPPFKKPPGAIHQWVVNYEAFKSVMQEFPRSFRYHLYRLYIQGYFDPNRRPIFKEFYESLKEWW